MAERQFYRPALANHYTSVLLIEHGEAQGAAVFVPPFDGADGWVQEYGTLREATIVAEGAALARGQTLVSRISDTNEWWLRGLTRV